MRVLNRSHVREEFTSSRKDPSGAGSLGGTNNCDAGITAETFRNTIKIDSVFEPARIK